MKLKEFLDYDLRKSNFNKKDLQMFREMLSYVPVGYFNDKNYLPNDLEEIIKELENE